jgi:hypothetical protein
MAELERRPRAPLAFLAGRVDVRRVYPPGTRPADPPLHRERTPTYLYGKQPEQRKRRGLLPIPPRRERPRELEATDVGARLYGQHGELPLTYRPTARVATVPTDVGTGDRLVLEVTDGRGARQVGLRINPSAGATAVLEVVLRRAGTDHVLFSSAAALTLEPLVALEDGDALVVRVATVGAAGNTATIAIFGELQR